MNDYFKMVASPAQLKKRSGIVQDNMKLPVDLRVGETFWFKGDEYTVSALSAVYALYGGRWVDVTVMEGNKVITLPAAKMVSI